MYLELTDLNTGLTMLVNMGPALTVKYNTVTKRGAMIEYTGEMVSVSESVEEIRQLLEAANPPVDPLNEIMAANMGGTLAMLVGQFGSIAMSADRIATALRVLAGTNSQDDAYTVRVGRIKDVAEDLITAIKEASGQS